METEPTDRTSAIFNEYRGLLFGIAYRMLGSAADAEDSVQEAFVRWLEADDAAVRSPRAFLSAVVVRLCIDHARLAHVKRETYPGPWLPEPIRTTDGDLADSAVLAESLHFAYLLLLENLAPLERAVFVLREAFDYSYPEIAAIVGKSEANCRQILHRAHQRLDQRQPRFAVSPEQQAHVTVQFAQALTNGDVPGLLHLLSPDVVFLGDGGGAAPTALKPVHGAANVARGSVGAVQKFWAGAEGRIEEFNGQPAIVGYLNGQVIAVMLLDVEGAQVRAVYAVLNPAKLAHLPPLAA